MKTLNLMTVNTTNTKVDLLAESISLYIGSWTYVAVYGRPLTQHNVKF